MFPTNSERLIGISDALIFCLCLRVSVILPTCSLYPQQKRAYSALHPQAWTFYTGRACRHLPSAVPWISEDRLFAREVQCVRTAVGRSQRDIQEECVPPPRLHHTALFFFLSCCLVYIQGDHGDYQHSSGAVRESRWTSWAVRPNELSDFRGRKELLNRASALVTTCP